MTKTLCIIVVSHERPALLRSQLLSLSSFFNHPECSVYVSDNSDRYSFEIDSVLQSFPSVFVKKLPGASQVKNLTSFTSFPRHKYLWILHDDDIVITYSVDLLLSRLSMSSYPLFCIPSFSATPAKPFRLICHLSQCASSIPFANLFMVGLLSIYF
jgi:hypothetical protein